MRLILILTTLLFLPQLAAVERGKPTAIISLWLDPRPLPPAAEPAAEARVFEQTLSRTVELFLPLSDSLRNSVTLAAGAFSNRKPFLLHVSRFDSGSPIIEFVPDAAQPQTSAINPHRQWAASQRGIEGNSPVFELFADVNALRHTFETSFASGRAGRIIHALGVPNARSLVLHGRWITPDNVAIFDPALPMAPAARRIGEYAKLNGPPLIRLDLSWSSRADEPTTIRGTNIAAGHWPIAQLKLNPPAAPFLCIFRADARTCLHGALGLRAAWLQPDEAATFGQAAITFIRANSLDIERIIGSLSSWMLLYPSSEHSNLLFAESQPRGETTRPAAIMHDFDQLMRKQFPDHIERIPDGASRFPAPADWPLSVIFWNPNPATPPSTLQFRILLRGGINDPGK